MSNPIEIYKRTVKDINSEYATLHSLSNDELRNRVHDIEQSISTHKNKAQALDKNLVAVFAIVKETARRFSFGPIEVSATPNDFMLVRKYDFVEIKGTKAIFKNRWDVMGVPSEWKMIHYDEQLLGGILLHYGFATEMATGEGKTLVATLPVFLNALAHEGVHVMTVNDYLSKRDFETTRPLYMLYGLSAECIENYGRHDWHHKEAYKMDIVFGENSTFVFDYLLDHLAIRAEDCVQQGHNYTIVDELDSILIDEADTPHIVSGGNHYNNEQIYKENFPLVVELTGNKEAKFYEVDKLKKSATFTQNGKNWLSAKKNIPDLFSVERTYEVADFENLPDDIQNEVRRKIELQNVFMQLLLALTVYERDVDYIIDYNKVKIIDPHTGRVKERHRWEHGLHTAIEVKEDVKVQNDYDGIGVISLKNYFKLYEKIAGMSGTVMSVEGELLETYNLKSASVPRHKPMMRVDVPLQIFKTAKLKDDAIIRTITENRSTGRPSLVGSISVKRSEQLCARLDEKGIAYNKLDAKTTKDEAIIVAKAGIGNTITVSTSVAGRGTDIKPSPDAIKAGGLLVIGTDLFESIRVDQQLKGRSGRQGDPGSSVFFASLDDQILKNLKQEDFDELQKLSSSYTGDDISTDEIRAYFSKAQANREAYFKSCRQEIAHKDDIVAPQRKKFYEQRNAVLFSADEATVIVDRIIAQFNVCSEDTEKNLSSLYSRAKELIVKSTKNNPNRKSILLPFSESLHTFTILLDVEPAITSFNYFCKEFKRQIVLQIYDKEWKQFVVYMMGNLDKKEVEQLDSRYTRMMNDINSVILKRLLHAAIPFETRNESSSHEEEENEDRIKKAPPKNTKRFSIIAADAPCPCGSGKKYCECHGCSIRSNNGIKRRR